MDNYDLKDYYPFASRAIRVLLNEHIREPHFYLRVFSLKLDNETVAEGLERLYKIIPPEFIWIDKIIGTDDDTDNNARHFCAPSLDEISEKQ